MQPLFEAANLLTQEIERTKQHLVNLEQALAGLRPLITIDAATMALPYTNQDSGQTVEDVSVVVKSPAKSKRSSKVRATSPGPAQELPATNTKFWLSLMGRKKTSVQDLVYNAINKLDMEEWARPKLKMRAQTWIYSSVKSGLLSISADKDGGKLYQRKLA